MKTFRGVVDDEDLNLNLEKEVQINEIHLNLIMGDQLSKKVMKNISSKVKLMEAAFKEKEFDSYFSLALGVQGARNIFVTEVGKHIEVYIEQSDNANSSLLVKKIFKNLLDTHFVRKLKISREAKIDKIFNHLVTKNEEVLGHINRYVTTRASILAQY